MRAAIDGGYTSGVADFKALVKYKLQSGLSFSIRFSIRGRDMLTEAPLGRMAAEEKMLRLHSLELDEIVMLGGQLKRLEHLQQNASSPSSDEILSDLMQKSRRILMEFWTWMMRRGV